MNIPENLDHEVKNIIDKLANFVARNGPQFEEMTKQKQKDNPRFGFLFGGEFYTYYKFRVASEIAKINQHQQHMPPNQDGMPPVGIPGAPPPMLGQPPPQPVTTLGHPLNIPPMAQVPLGQPGLGPPGLGLLGQAPPGQQPIPSQGPPTGQWPPQQPPPPNPQLQEQITQAQQHVNQLQASIGEQVSQSEKNLQAQYQMLMGQQQSQIEETIMKCLEEKLLKLLNECELTMQDFDTTVQPIIDSCTKDAILSGKNWIMQRIHSQDFCDAIAQYLLKRITAKEAPFQLRLHLIYLMNDVLHHCVKRNEETLKGSLEKVVVPIFCTSSLSAGEDKITKLNKLLELWEKNKYFAFDTIEKMKDPSQAISSYQANLITENAQVVTTITTGIQQQYTSLEKQHQDFVSHLNLQLTTAQQQLQALLSQANGIPDGSQPTPDAGVAQGIVPQTGPLSFPPSSLAAAPPHAPGANMGGFLPNDMFGAPNQQPQQFEYNHSSMGTPSMMPQDMPQSGMPNFLDFSRPPPGFAPPFGPPPNMVPPSDIDLTPSVPYYELPAGLIAPLVRLEEFDYKPLDPKDMRLPPPMPPSERLLAAVEAFYEQPSRERPRDGDGWERLGLYEFFRAKQRARRLKEEGRGSRSRSRSGSRSQSPTEETDESSLPAYRRYNTDVKRSVSRSRSRSRSASRSRSRSTSRSPQRRQRSHSRSKSPRPHIRSSKSPSPRRPELSRARSPTPPSFMGGSQPTTAEARLGEDNKGHMLMKKMGWSGKGLGTEEQGIVNPVEAADVRDRSDMHKGIGINLRDPFEQFRKSKSHGFIQRMRARDEEREKQKEKRKKSRFNE